MKKARNPIHYMMNKSRGGKGTMEKPGKFLGKGRSSKRR